MSRANDLSHGLADRSKKSRKAMPGRPGGPAHRLIGPQPPAPTVPFISPPLRSQRSSVSVPPTRGAAAWPHRNEHHRHAEERLLLAEMEATVSSTANGPAPRSPHMPQTSYEPEGQADHRLPAHAKLRAYGLCMSMHCPT